MTDDTIELGNIALRIEAGDLAIYRGGQIQHRFSRESVERLDLESAARFRNPLIGWILALVLCGPLAFLIWTIASGGGDALLDGLKNARGLGKIAILGAFVGPTVAAGYLFLHLLRNPVIAWLVVTLSDGDVRRYPTGTTDDAPSDLARFQESLSS